MIKPPCECIRHVNGIWMYCCECSNGGDAETAAYWVADKNRQAEITALRAEVERLRVENIQMQAALGYGILAEDERHILPSNPFKCGTCDASKHLRAENERLRAALWEIASEDFDFASGNGHERAISCARAALEEKP